jgi:hypothetical protein
MKIEKLLLPLVAVVFATTSHAQLIDMQVEWSGAYYGNGASAVATFTLDTSQINNPGNSSLSGSAILPVYQNFQITVSNASTGNGVFTASDFSTFIMNIPTGSLDFNSELVGQSTPTGPWGTLEFVGPIMGSVGDFILFSSGSNPLVPNATNPLTMNTGGGESMLLISYAPIPEPASWMMGCLAMGTSLCIFRRRSAARA